MHITNEKTKTVLERVVALFACVAVALVLTACPHPTNGGSGNNNGNTGEETQQDISDTNFTYTSDFTSTRFYYVKDVQWSINGSAHTGYVDGPDWPISGNSEDVDDRLTAADWPEGTYITLSETGTTTTPGNYGVEEGKTIPTYTVTLHTPRPNGSYATSAFGTNTLIILGLDSNNGFMCDNNGWGTFFYTQKGWAASNNGTDELTLSYDVFYPTLDEILDILGE